MLVLAGLAAKLVGAGAVLAPAWPAAALVPTAATVGLLSVATLPLWFVRAGGRLAGAVVINLVGSTLIMADVWHARFYGDVLSIAQVSAPWQVSPVAASLAALARPADALIVSDVVLCLALAWWGRRVETPARTDGHGWRAALIAAGVGLSGLAVAAASLSSAGREALEYEYYRAEVVGAVGLAGYHAYDLAQHARFVLAGRLEADPADVDRFADVLARRRDGAVASRLAGVAAGRNLLLISAESVQTFALELTLDGEPLTPNLRAFAAESLDFREHLDQTHLGTTSDGEFMALNSLLPLQTGAVASRYEANTFRALPAALAEAGYATFSACGEPPAFWNMREMHASYGITHSRFLPDFTLTEWIGAGLDDKDMLAQVLPSLDALPEPFFSFLLTSSNHHPYALPARLRPLDPEPLAGTMAGGYLQSVRRFDDAFGQLIGALRSSGLLDRTVVAVYGDHQAWLDDAELRRLWALASPGRDPTPYDLWRFRKRVPLLIRLPGGAHAGVRTVPGGHLDVGPTLLSLVGVDAAGPWLGRDLTAPDERLVAFRDGSVTNGVLTLAGAMSEDAQSCWTADGRQVDCSLLTDLRQEARAEIEMSDAIIRGNLAAVLTERRRQATPALPRALGRPLVIAHRGASLAAPENTLPAIAAAFAAGADLAEVDVRLSSDGVPMLFHDETLDRITGVDGPLERRTAAELRRLDAGRWKDPRFAGVRIPTLEEALRASGGRLYLDLTAEGLAGPIGRAYDAAGIPRGEAWIAAWTGTERDDFSKEFPGARIVDVRPPPAGWGAAWFEAVRGSSWGVELGDVWPDAFVGAAARAGVPVFAYTVNDTATMQRLIEMGVAGIETDDPARLVSLLAPGR